MSDDPTETPTIQARGNGPLLVKNVSRLEDAGGATLDSKATMALCRCGASGNKPFCDGSHAKVGFSGDNTADTGQDRQARYPGNAGEILDNRFVCAHVGLCTDRLAAVFKYGEEPWIDPDGAPAEAIAEVVRQCPSGALAVTMQARAGGSEEGPSGITVSRNGPYYVRGGIDLAEARWGEGADPQRYALCRCGASKNKPFCDGSHWAIEFNDGSD